LNLSSNPKLGDPAMEELAHIYEEKCTKLTKLELNNVGATSRGMGPLFFALRNNNFLTHLSVN